jgi:hypothetical protein
MNRSDHPAGLGATPLLERKRELLARSQALRGGLADACRHSWQIASEPLDRAWTWRTRLLRLWQAGQTITARRPWLVLAVPLGWRLLRGVLWRRQRPARAAGRITQAATAAPVSSSSRAVRWAGRLSAWWSAWRVLRPVLQVWLDESGLLRPSSAGSGSASRHPGGRR